MIADPPRKALFLGKWCPAAATVLGLIGGALGAFDGLQPPGAVAIGLAIVSFVTSIIAGRRVRRYRQNSLSSVSGVIFSAVDVNGALRDLAKRMGLAPPWRISLYEAKGNEWLRVARCSNYPRYESSGRQKFHLDQGCLSWALKTGAPDELQGLPDPTQDFTAYANIHSSRNIDGSVAIGFTMPSRSYVAVAYCLRSGSNTAVNVGCLVESMDPAGVSRNVVSRHLTIEMVSVLYQLISLRPALERAKSIVEAQSDTLL